MKVKVRNKAKLALVYESILVILAFISVILLFYSEDRFIFLDKIVWLLFFIDVVVRLVLAKNKWNYIKKNPFDIIAALPLDAIFQTARIARLFRILRLLAISRSILPHFFQILKTNNLDRVLIVATLLVVSGGTIVTYTEPDIHSFSDGLWWAIVTTTTVGYGDISPDTITGRIVAVFLMLIGIGMIGMLTGSITTFFIKDEPKQHATITFMNKQLQRIEKLTPEEINQLIVLLQDYKKRAEDNEKLNSKIE
ncbi:potassium channel family protein [Virgibacillus sp. W0430]|uniref:potassium channel family protein n=1 Tax=Virgibacillus sp. W0430 TaxID=3391580 RepID=UPI003F475DD7